MIRILFISDRDKEKEKFQKLLDLNKYFCECVSDVQFITDLIKVEPPDIIIYDTETCIDFKALSKTIKPLCEKAVVLLLISDKFDDRELIKYATCKKAYCKTP